MVLSVWAWGRGFGAVRMSARSLLTILEGQKERYREKFGVVLRNKVRSELRAHGLWGWEKTAGHLSCLDHQACEPGELPKTAKSVFIEPDKRLAEERGPGRCHHWSHVKTARAGRRQGPSPRCPACSTTIPRESLSPGTMPSSSSPSIPRSFKGRIGGKLFLLFLFNFSALLFFSQAPQI